MYKGERERYASQPQHKKEIEREKYASDPLQKKLADKYNYSINLEKRKCCMHNKYQKCKSEVLFTRRCAY